ncbi:BapA/Bap/LapF family large adhesin [Sphingomonas sp. PB1R3]|uniref:BapA/Bap/LapF family large adhesin n=1 Tax=Sphingomonas flavida TaxID=3096154 RepID=UPI002FC8B70D
MQTQIIAKATGASTTANGDLIELGAPSVVRLDLDRSRIATMVREGDDLVIRLTDGQTIRVDHFYGEQKGGDSDLVLRDQQGGQWLAHPSSSGSGRFTAIRDIDDLMGTANDTHDRGGGFILPAVLGAAGIGGLIAAVSGGKGRNDSDKGDAQAPGQPTAGFTARGDSVTGRGEPGATIRVTDPQGNVIGTGTVGADGSFNIPVTTPQTNGQPANVTQTDPAGNTSPVATVIAPDMTAPSAPTAAVNGQGTTITGTGEPGATVTVRDASGQPLGSTTVGSNGNYTLQLTTPQANGGTVTVTQADPAGNVSPAATFNAPDTTPPVAPTATITGNGATVTGTGEPGATVTVRDAGGQVLGTTPVAADGGYSVTLTTPQANGGTLTVTQADPAGNTSPATTIAAADTTAPAAPVVVVSADGATLTGTGEAGATVQVRDAAGQPIGTATVAADGSFSVALPAGTSNGQTLSVAQSDAAGNTSPSATAPTPDLVAPGAPTASVASDGASITGTGEPGATVQVRDGAGTVIGTATVDAQSGYTAPLATAQANGQALSVTQSDAAGNVSPPVALTAPDITPPAPPLATLSSDGASVYGNGEPGATVRIVDGNGTLLGTAVVAADSSYAVTLATPQTNGQQLSANQTDPAGNISLPSNVAAPDVTAPGAPVATISADGSIVTGTGEPVATVAVRDPGGAVIGTATVAADGSFSTTLTPTQANGEALTLNQTDRGGNASPDTGLLAPDITAPTGLTAAISGDGAIVSGTGEAGASVTIRDPAGTIIGTATVAANGSYSATLTPAQANGQTLQATQADAAGNVSAPANVIAPDITPPLAPTGSVIDNGATLVGTGEAGATLIVRAADGTVLGSGLVDANGNFAVTLNPAQANGEPVQIAQSDAAGNTSASVTVLAPDITAPIGLTAAISGDGAIVSGTGEAGASVTIRDPAGTIIGTATVTANGSYSAALTPAQTNGQTLQATQADAAGNVSAPANVLAPDTTAPLAPTGSVVDSGATLAGTGEAGATLTVRAADGTVLGSGLVDANGNFSVTLNPVQANGQTLQIAQSDAAGNASPSVSVLAPDITAPIGLTAAISGDGAIVTGLGEAGATVTIRNPGGAIIGTATVDQNGSYAAILTTPQRNGEVLQVTQADAANNVSAPAATTAPDLTAPLAPVGTLSADGAQVTGTGEAGATVSVRAADGTVLGTAVVDAGGAFTVALSAPQANGQTLAVVQADAAGNVSPALSLTATDTTAPIGLTASVDGTGTVVSGQAEAGATVTVRDPAGQVIGTGTAGTTGAYAVALTTPQVDGEQLQVTQADTTGNTAPPTPATAPDITAPAAPVFALDANGANASGSGEVGAAVTLRDAGGTVIGTGTIGADGRFTVALSPAQANGGTVGATLTDAAGNVSPVANAPAPDITAPAAPAAALDATGGIVSGTGEVGATVTVRAADGTILGTGVVGSQGAYAVALSAAQLNSQVLNVVQADAAGNSSPSTTVTALDRIPPAPPVASVSADGATLTGTGEVGAVVTITDPVGQVIATVPVGADGSFGVTLSPPLTNGQILSLTQADAAGNVSQAGNATAPDLIPNDTPLAPTATFAGDGASVSGTGQAGTAITVRDASGAVIGTGTVAADGSYSATLTTPQLNGETVRVTQTDAEGDVSPPAVAIAPDLTPPAIPVAAINATGAVVSGTGEIGATVRVLDTNGAVLGTATVGATGAYAVVLVTPQVNNQALTVVQADATGNVSPGAALTAPDITAPLAPTGQVAGDGTSVTGTGEAGATVTIRDAVGTVIGTAQVAGDGSFTAPLSPVQANGQALTLTQADPAGNTSPVTAVAAPDITAPVGLTAAIDSAGTLVTGQGEAGTTVTIRDATNTIVGTATVATDGTYAAILTPPQANGQLLQAVQADAAGNGSAPIALTAPDITAPLAPAGIVSGDGTTLTGTGEAGATVTIRAPGGAVIGTALVAADGSFTAPLTPAQANGQVLTLTQADPTGNVSPVAQAPAPDITAPVGLTAAIDGAGTIVTGQGEAGATVTIRDPNAAVIGTATVAANGTYTAILTTPQLNAQLLQVTQADAAGNVAAPATVTAPDLTAPLAPAGTVSGDGTTLTGTGEAGATVTIRAPDGTIIATVLVAGDGSFTAPLNPAQANGQLLTLTQADPTGNVSPVAQAPAPDITAPTGLTAAINGAGTIVSGTGEAGATVTVRDALGNPLGTVVVAAGGTYAVTLTTPQANGEALSVAQADATGNTSPAIPLTAPDITAPLAPAGIVSGDGTTLTGTGEAGATVTIRAPEGTIIATVLVAGDGSFTAPLNPAQANGQLLTLTQADPTGNVSPAAQAPAPDITAPVGLTTVINGVGTIVSGTGEAGATVTVRDTLGNAIGTGTVATDGTYAVTLTTPQANGQALSVVQADATGNTSTPIPLAAPDITPPAVPTALVNGVGTVVTGTGEAGATVRILDPQGQLVGTAVIDANGAYTAALTTAQANGQVLSVTQVDPAGNPSPQIVANAPDITQPPAPTAAINGTGTIVTGTGEIGTTVEVRNAGGTVIGTGTVAAGGVYAVTLLSPQVAGQTLAIGLRDGAGNVSTSVAITAPFDISAFDNVASATVDLVPVQTNETLGNANYTALASLGLVNVDAQVLAIPNVQFTVDPGHTLATTFTYDATLSLGAASGYSVVLQRFDGTNWVAVNGGGNTTLLQVGLLGGDLVAAADLDPGQYRAFVTFDNTAGVGLVGGLRVTGVDSDFTDVGQVVPAVTNGNVISDPGPGGQVDVVSPQTRVESVTVNGVTTSVTADDTVVTGQWGTLIIDRDGTYNYTPNALANVVGQTDRFTYTLLDASDNERESATLTINIGSPDVTGSPVAVNDVATASATFVNVVQTLPPVLDTTFGTPTASLLSGPQTGQTVDSFTVDANSLANVTLRAEIAPGLSVLPSVAFTVTNSAGAVVGTANGTAVAGVGGLVGASYSVTIPNLAAGTYNYTVSSTNPLGGAYTTSVFVGETVTRLDQFTFTGATPVSGNVLANDTLGTPFLGIKLLVGGSFVDVGDAGLTLAGAHGSLTIDEVGRYTYQPTTPVAYAAADPIDSFTYQIVQPDGQVSTARLDVAIDIANNGVAPVFPSAAVAALSVDHSVSFTADVVPMMLTTAEQHQAVTTADHGDARMALSMMEGQGSVEDVLSRYLEAHAPTSDSVTVANDLHAIPTASEPVATPDLPQDPLGYLTVSVDPEHEKPVTMHIM